MSSSGAPQTIQQSAKAEETDEDATGAAHP
jgi:hypothetical protein